MRVLSGLAAASLAATALLAGPASAGDSDRRFTGIPSDPVFGSGIDRRRLRGTDTVFVYDREYQGDTAWRAESFNDWWHERPNRSYPAWVQRNRDCQRKWWSGETLTC
jgi:hypothetical protein